MTVGRLGKIVGVCTAATVGTLLAVAVTIHTVPTAEPLVRALVNPLYAWNRPVSSVFVLMWPAVAAAVAYRRDALVAVAAVLGGSYGAFLPLYWPMVLCCEGTFVLFRFDTVFDLFNGVTAGMFGAAVLLTAGLGVPPAVTAAAVRNALPSRLPGGVTTREGVRRLPRVAGLAASGSFLLVWLVSSFVPSGHLLAVSVFDPTRGVGASLVPFLLTWVAATGLLTVRMDVPAVVSVVFGVEFGGVLAAKLVGKGVPVGQVWGSASALAGTVGFSLLIAYLLTVVVAVPTTVAARSVITRLPSV